MFDSTLIVILTKTLEERSIQKTGENGENHRKTIHYEKAEPNERIKTNQTTPKRNKTKMK